LLEIPAAQLHRVQDASLVSAACIAFAEPGVLFGAEFFGVIGAVF